jgi:hypothetical protein
VLDTGKYQALLGPEMPTWQTGLADYFAEWRSLEAKGAV